MVSLVTTLLFVAPSLAVADLPVHCLRHQIVGDWEFTVGPPSSTRSSCGHEKPDDQARQPAEALVSGGNTKIVHLSDPNVASSSDDPMGSWTMIYDEGFEVVLDGHTYFAFSKFDLLADGKNISHCDATMVGWYHNDRRDSFGCYVAKKKSTQGSFLGSDSTSYRARSTDGWGDISSILSLSQMPQTRKRADWDVPRSQRFHEAHAARINLLQTSWTAKAYPKFAGKSLRELNRMVGIKRSMSNSEHEAMLKEHFRQPTVMLAQQKARTKRMAAKMTMPDSLDYRKWEDMNIMEPVIDQGDCGSCYTVATTRMLSARAKKKERNPSKEPFSISFPLYCAEYNQGCNGGYAFLSSKFSQDVGLIPTRCAHYTPHGRCEVTCKAEDVGQRYRAANHHYIGGYYGGANDYNIQEELVANGPVVVSFEPKSDLMYYNGGIYKSGIDPHQEWERVDHAVLLVGYGEENGQKYWTVQNSWGPEWGENGFFRIARGDNDSGIEGIAVAADVVEDDNSQVLDTFLSQI